MLRNNDLRSIFWAVVSAVGDVLLLFDGEDPVCVMGNIETDTIIFFIYSQIRKYGILDPVVIDAEDTDVVVLSAFVAHNTDGILAIKRKKDIINCRDLCPEDIAEIIVPVHIF